MQPPYQPYMQGYGMPYMRMGYPQEEQESSGWTTPELMTLNKVIIINSHIQDVDQLTQMAQHYLHGKSGEQIRSKLISLRGEMEQPNNGKKRKREKSESPRKKQKITQTASNSAKHLETLMKNEPSEENTEQQEGMIGNVLEDNQEMIVNIRRNLQNNKFEDNVPLMNIFRGNIRIVLESLNRMGGISNQMAPLDVHLSPDP